MEKYELVEKTIEYNTSYDPTSAPDGTLVAGSKNVMIDGRNGKVRARPGYTRLGAPSDDLDPILAAYTWHTSMGQERPVRFYNDAIEVYLKDVDGVDVSAWTPIINGGFNTKARCATWYDATEAIDLLLIVAGNTDIFEWGGGVASVASVDSGTLITKNGDDTWAQAHFYTTRDKVMVCVRTGTEYTYTTGFDGTQLTVSDSTDLQAGDILIQKLVQHADVVASDRINHTIFVHENQVWLGSELDNQVYIFKNTSLTDFGFSAPRLSGEGGLLTLDNPVQGFAAIGKKPVVFAGRSSIYTADFTQITVGSDLAETIAVRKLDTGVDQGAQNQETIVAIGDGVMYLTFEPAIRFLGNPDELTGINPTTLSNPIKADFDAENWGDACAIWYKNAYILSAPANSHVYILETIQDAQGRPRRFWHPPQILPAHPFSIIDDALHFHSNVVPETYKAFDGLSDTSSSDEKLPINAKACFNYRNFGDAALLKNFDEYFVEGEISPSTVDLTCRLDYDFGGHTQELEETINGSDQDILEATLSNSSLGQQPLGTQPLAASLFIPDDAAKFRVIFEIAKEDFHEMQTTFETNDVDRYWAILRHGPNAKLSARRDTTIKK